MQQTTLDLDPNEETVPGPVLDPEQQQQLIALMAEAIVAVRKSNWGEDREPA